MPYKNPQKSLEAVKRHYDTHRDKVLKNKVINRILTGITPHMASLHKFDITEDMVNEMRAEVGLDPITIKPTRRSKKKAPEPEPAEVKPAEPTRSKKKAPEPAEVTLQQIHDHYNSMVEEGKIAERTGGQHYVNFRRIILATGCEHDNMIVCLKNPSKIIDYINTLKIKKTGKDVAINTKHTYMTAILNAIDTNPVLAANVSRDVFKAEWDRLGQLKDTSNTQRQLTDTVESFTSIKKRIEANNPSLSQEVLMINLYDQITPRNDFDDLTTDTSDPNHIDLNDGTITLKDFKKTNKKYAPIINYKLSKHFMELLKKSLKANPREKVFTKQLRSIFKKAKTGVDAIRHGKISEELAGSNLKDPVKREKLRVKMLHSSAMQLQYIRTLRE